MADALNTWGEPLPRRTTTDPVVRIVLAEAAASPGPLHYILESEGFQILGSASDDADLTRILSQRIEPDVIVVDAAVPATTVMTAQEFAPASELIVVWPEGIVPPASADQVFPDLVFEELGPAVRRAAERNRLRHPIEDEPDEMPDVTWLEPEGREVLNVAAGRTAARVLVGTVAVIASLVVTMGASFALQGWRATHQVGPARIPVAPTSAPGRGHGSSALGATPLGAAPSRHTNQRCDAVHGSGPNDHASTKADQASDCSNLGGSSHAADHRQNGATRDTGRGSGRGDHGTGQGDQGSGVGQGSAHGQGSGQGDHGSGQGDRSGQGDQGSGHGDQGSGSGSGSGSGDQGSNGTSSAGSTDHPGGVRDTSAGHGRARQEG